MDYSWLDGYLLSMKGATKDFKVEWQWTRYLIGNKMFAAVCKDEKGKDSLITFKLEPLDGEFLRQQYEDVIPGYYMNKQHWNSVKMEGVVPEEVIKDALEKSYCLVFNGLTKKLRLEIENNI